MDDPRFRGHDLIANPIPNENLAAVEKENGILLRNEDVIPLIANGLLRDGLEMATEKVAVDPDIIVIIVIIVPVMTKRKVSRLWTKFQIFPRNNLHAKRIMDCLSF